MAQLRQTSQIDFAKVSVASVPGLNPEDIAELKALKKASVKKVMDEMDAHQGDLTQLSNAEVAVIEPEQSDRIGDAIVAYVAAKAETQAQKDWAKQWSLSSPAAAALLQDGQPRKGFLDGLLGR